MQNANKPKKSVQSVLWVIEAWNCFFGYSFKIFAQDFSRNLGSDFWFVSAAAKHSFTVWWFDWSTWVPSIRVQSLLLDHNSSCSFSFCQFGIVKFPSSKFKMALKAYLHGRFQLCDIALRCVFEAKESTLDCIAISLEKFLFTLKSHRNAMSQLIISSQCPWETYD